MAIHRQVAKFFSQFFILLTTIILLAGCTALSTSIEHKDLVVSSKMSDSIFLEPVSSEQQTVYLQVRNTSDQSSFDINSDLQRNIQQNGYRIVYDVAQANFLLQVNILKIDKMTPGESDAVLSGGFGAALGGVTGSVVSNGDPGTTLAGAVVGGVLSTVTNSLVKQVNYVVVTDVQLSVRSKQAISQSSQSKLSQGSSTVERQHSSGTTHWQKYRTRVVSTADKVNLTFAEAEQPLEQDLAHSIAGIL